MNNVSSRTTATFTIAALVTFSGGLISGAWWARGLLEEQTLASRRMEAKVDALTEQVAALRQEVWTLRDMNTWAGRFRWENRAIDLSVPEPREWRDFRAASSR